MKLSTKNTIAYGISRLISRGVPLFSVFIIYGVFEQTEPKLKLTGWSMIAITIFFLLFFKDLKEKAEKLVESQWKHAINESKVCVIFLVVWVFIQWAKSGIFEIELLVSILVISQALAIYPASLHLKYRTMLEKGDDDETEETNEEEAKEKSD